MKNIKRLLLLITLSALLVVSIQVGCDDLITEQITVIEAGHPVADFDLVSPADGFCCAGFEVEFRDASDGPRQIYIWDFGDGIAETLSADPSTYEDPTHIYDTPGIFTVSLTIIDTVLDGEDTETKPRFIYVGTTPADFTADPGSACLGTEMFFYPVEHSAITYEWDFGDGSDLDSSTFPTHLYADSGTYTVTLNISDSCGEASSTLDITIGMCPAVSFVALDSTGCAPFTVNFADSTDTFGLSVISRTWDFGDGVTSFERDPVHEYTNTGQYTVKLTVVTDGGSSADSVIDFITVVDQTIAAFDIAGDTAFCKSDFQQFQVNFLNQSYGSPDSFLWSFGDGFKDTATNPVHVYVTPGIYSCTLEATGPCGTDTIAKDSLIVFADTLQDAFIVLVIDTVDGGGVMGSNFRLRDASATGVRTDWTFYINEAEVSTGSPQYETPIDVDGTYGIKMVVTNECGVIAEDSVELIVPLL